MIDRRQALMGMGALALATTMPGRPRAQAFDGAARIREIAQGLIAERRTPGLQIAVRRGTEVIFEEAFGSANLETGTALTPVSPMRIGSVTKQFTGAALLSMESDGLLSLSDPLAKFFPDFPRAADITLDRMLTHTSGLGNYTDRASMADFIQDARRDRDTTALLQAMRETETLQVFEPGTGWAYSNTAYVLLGLVIEQAAGTSWGEVMRTRLLDPAGLTLTGVDDTGEVQPGRASGYTNDAQAESGFDNASYIAMSYPGAAGAMQSTAGEMVRWHQALLGGRVLAPAALERMLTPATLNDGSLPTDNGQPVRYGAGVSVGPIAGREAMSHGGGIFGFQSDLTTFRDADVSIGFIANTDSGDLGAGRRAIRDAALDALA